MIYMKYRLGIFSRLIKIDKEYIIIFVWYKRYKKQAKRSQTTISTYQFNISDWIHDWLEFLTISRSNKNWVNKKRLRSNFLSLFYSNVDTYY